MSPARLAWQRFWRQPAAQRAVALLALLYGAALFAPFLAPVDPLRPQDHASWMPPNVSFIDAAGRARWRPVVHQLEPRTDDSGRRTWRAVPGADVPLRWFVGGAGAHLFGTDAGAATPHLLGTDQRGRDLFARIVHGARISLSIGLVGVALSFAIGMVVGGLAGWYGGRLDDLLMRTCELLMLLPGFYVLLALRGALPDTAEWSSTRTYATVVAIVSTLYWAGLARTIRGQVLALRRLEFVQAAQALGARTPRILARHVLPGTLSIATVAATVAIPGYIVMESGLSMLGLGIQEPEPSWGNLLADACRISQIADHPWLLAPGLFLCAAIAAFQELGDRLRDALDPRS